MLRPDPLKLSKPTKENEILTPSGGGEGEKKDKEKGFRMTPTVYNLRGQGLILE